MQVWSTSTDVKEARMAHVPLADTPLNAVLLLAWRSDGPLGDEPGARLVSSVRTLHAASVDTGA